MHEPKLLLETPRFRVVRQPVPTSDGSPLSHSYVQHSGAVVVAPRLADGRVCLIRNYRVAVDQTLIEAPAGTLELGESLEANAHRELKEETGYTAGKLTPLPPFYMSPGILSERMHPFLATDLTAGEPAREPGEQIENLLLPWDEAIDLIRRGEITDAKTIAVLMYCERFVEER